MKQQNGLENEGVARFNRGRSFLVANEALAAGYYLGVDGPLTYKKNEALRAIFAAAPLERILIETDAPFLTPQARRGTRNEPAYVSYVAA